MENIQYTAYEQVIECIRNSVRDYYGRHANEKLFELYLANDEHLTYSIPESSIAHLLGVNVNYIISTSCLTFQSRSAIEVLNRLCENENTHRIYSKISNGYLDFKQMFSDYTGSKLIAFENNIQPNVYQMEFVCKINRDICHSNGVDPINAEYILCSKDNNDNYLVLGISWSKNGYNATTNQMFSSFDELKSGLGAQLMNQELTFMSKILIRSKFDDYRINAILKPNEKNDKISALEKYRDAFNGKICITYDYSMLAKQTQQSYDNINTILDFMENKKTITSATIDSLPYLGNNLKRLINAYNNVLNNAALDQDGNSDYSDLQKENENLRNELYQLKSQISQLSEVNAQLQAEHTELLEERDTYKEVISNVGKEVQKVFSKYLSNNN